MNRTLNIALCTAALICAGAPLAVAETIEVTATRLNVRTGPSTRNRIILTAQRGNKFTVLQRSGSWKEVALFGGKGWLYHPYTRVVAATPPATPPASTTRTEACIVGVVNVRSGPSTRYRVVGRLSRGQRVPVLGVSGSWKRITFNGQTAYAFGGYLGQPQGAATPTPTPPPVNPPSRRTSRAGYIQLPASGFGFVAYSSSSKRWGRPNLIYGMERTARRFKNEGRTRARIRVGNISRENGGILPPHISHRYGKDMDVAPLRSDGLELPVTIYSSRYSRSLNQRVIDILKSEVRARVVLFNDRRVRGVSWYPGHHNHFHFSAR